MATPVYLDQASLIPRLVLWLALWLGMAVVGVVYREARGRGYALFYVTFAVVTAYCLENAMALGYANAYDDHLGKEHDTPHAKRLFGAYIFFDDLSESMLIGLLLLVSAGFCITRQDLGSDRKKAVIFPVVYCITSLIFDFVIFHVAGRAPFDAENDAEIVLDDLAPGADLALFLCAIVSLMVKLFSWMSMFEMLKRERSLLRGELHMAPERAPSAMMEPETEMVTRNNPLAVRASSEGSRAGEKPSGSMDADDDTMATMHAVDIDVERDLEGNLGADPGAAGGARTVEDGVANAHKGKLLQRFSWGITWYILTSVAVLLLPLFFDQGDHAIAIHRLLVVQNVVLWAFMVILAIVFRPKPDNPYLVLDEDAGEFSTALGVETAEAGQSP